MNHSDNTSVYTVGKRIKYQHEDGTFYCGYISEIEDDKYFIVRDRHVGQPNTIDKIQINQVQ